MSDSTEDAGGLEEIVPESLMPLYRRYETIQAFRETYGAVYTGALEAVTAIILTAGYLFWLYLFLTGGG